MSIDANAQWRPLPWLRLYCEIVDDPKLRLLAFEDRWHFVALLALKGSGILDGNANADLRSRLVAVKLGLQSRDLEAVAKRLAEVGLIDPETYQPLAWDRRQAPSDSSRDRTRNWRERQRVDRHGDGHVTLQKENEKETKKQKDHSLSIRELIADRKPKSVSNSAMVTRRESLSEQSARLNRQADLEEERNVHIAAPR